MKRRLQIDVKGSVPGQDHIIECNLYFDGGCYKFYTSKANYEALLHEGLFIRDGKTRDSADVLNTTNDFEEVIKNSSL